MRFVVVLELKDDKFFKDKNKVFSSWIKFFMERYDKYMYKKLYNSGAIQKDFTFSLYFGKNVVFDKEHIYVPEKKVLFNFSCYNTDTGLHFYNIFRSSIDVEYEYKHIKIKAIKVDIAKDVKIKDDKYTFRTLSPIIIREHKNHDNKSNYFHDINTPEGKIVFVNNIKQNLINYFGDDVKYDIDNINIDIISSKKVTVRHYDINIPSNLCNIVINAKPYIIEYLYLSGAVSSMSASGFGMMKLIK